MKLRQNIGIAIPPFILAVTSLATAWFIRYESAKHAYVLFVAGGFMSAAAYFLLFGHMNQDKRIVRAGISIALGTAVILYGKGKFLSGVM